MKSLFLFVVLGMISLWLIVPSASAQTDINAFLDEILGSFGNTASFGFKTTDTISAVKQTDTSVELSFPIVMSGSTTITKYSIAGYNVSLENLDNIDLVDSSLTISQDATVPTEQVTAKIGKVLVTGLNPGTTYYFSITPKGPNGESGTASKEVVYNPATATSQSSTNSPTNQQGSAANMNLANVTYTINGLSVTMKWTPIGGADKIQMSYTTPGNNTAQILGTPAMADGTFTFSIPRADTYLVKLQPLRADNAQSGTEIVQTIRVLNADGTTTTPTNPNTPIPVVPNVGPKEDAMVVIFGSLFCYLCYQLYRKVTV